MDRELKLAVDGRSSRFQRCKEPFAMPSHILIIQTIYWFSHELNLGRNKRLRRKWLHVRDCRTNLGLFSLKRERIQRPVNPTWSYLG